MTLLYRVSGFTLASDRPLTFLPAAPAAAVPDIQVRFAPVPVGEGVACGRFLILSPDCIDLAPSDGLRVRVEQGCRMTVDAQEGITDGEIQTYLFGPAFAALLYQRGIPPLHASAVRLSGGGAVALAGQSGAGKSTTSWALVRAGHSFLCDDQIVVDPHTAMAQAGFPAMKLWGLALSHFGREPGAAPAVAQGMDKYHMDAPGDFDTTPARLRAICILAPDADRQAPQLVRLSMPEAVAALGALAHHAYLADALGRRQDIFSFGAALVAAVPVFLLLRPVDLGQLDGVVALVREAALG